MDAMDARDKHLLPLLWWLFSSAPSIHSLNADELLSSTPTPHQFFLYYPPQVEQRFQRAKHRAGGSAWAFHGSPSESWLSTVLTGLKNLRSLCHLRPLHPYLTSSLCSLSSSSRSVVLFAAAALLCSVVSEVAS